MIKRANYAFIAPEIMENMQNAEKLIDNSWIDLKLKTLIKILTSQLNSCVFCLDMHSKDAIDLWEDLQKLLLLPAFLEAPIYSDLEKAVLTYTRDLTLLWEKWITDEVYQNVAKYFDEKMMSILTYTIIISNSWNRLNIAFANFTCDYKPWQ